MVNRNVRSYQRGNQNPLIEGQTINWRQEMIEDTKEVSRILLLKDMQYTGQQNVKRYQRGNRIL